MSTLQKDFGLGVASHAEVDECFRVMGLAMADDEIWKPMMGTIPFEKTHEWTMKNLSPRWKFPDIEIYKITEKSSGKIVAWTALQYPWQVKPIADDLKEMAMSDHMPPLLEGMDLEAAKETMAMLTCCYPLGYKPEEEFHRKGTMVHPDFQKKGFGSVLTDHTNSIADLIGGKTWAPARPTSAKMFLNKGFEIIGFHDSNVERWGEPAERGKTLAMRRESGALILN